MDTLTPYDALKTPWKHYLFALCLIAVCTVVNFTLLPYSELANPVMVYLAGVLAAALWFNRKVAIVTSVLSVLVLDFYFVFPHFSMSISKLHHLMTFGFMLAIALILSFIIDKIRRQAATAISLERRSTVLAALSHDLALARGESNLLAVGRRHLLDVFKLHSCFLLPDEKGNLLIKAYPDDGSAPQSNDLLVAQRILANGREEEKKPQALPGAFRFIPLFGAHSVVGVLAVKAADDVAEKLLYNPDLFRFLSAFVGQIARALEVDNLAETARKTLLEMEHEKLRSSLLSAVTHDLQTPLAAIAGSAESLLVLREPVEQNKIKNLAENIYEEAVRLSRLINNFLRIARLESGSVKIHQELVPIEEIVGAALARTESILSGHPVRVDFPPDLPMVSVDAVLMEHLFVNILENAAKYTPLGTPVTLTGKADRKHLIVEICDRGPGLEHPEDLERIFERFYRVNPRQDGGHGIGLAICSLVAQKIHRGSISAENIPEGGLRFKLSLPL